MEPLQYLNIPQIYSQYSAIFDFTIYLVLFVGLARVAFEKKFEGRGGKAVIAAVGIALAVGLSMAEAKFGFNLASLGGIAATTLIFAFGFLLFNLLSSLGLSKTTALAWSFILLFVFLNSISQKLMAFIQRKFPVLNLLFLISVLLVIIKGISFVGTDNTLKYSAQGLLRKGAGLVKDVPIREEKYERRNLRDENKTIHKEIRISSKMVKQLYEIKSLIKEFGDTEQGRKAVAKQIESLAKNEIRLLQKLAHLRDLDKQLEELDILAMRKLKEEYGEVPDEFKTKVASEIQAEKEKYQLSLKMGAFEDRVKQCVDGFNLCIRSCVEYLGKNHIFEALQSIDKTIEYQMAIEKLFEEMEKTGNFMAGLTKREYKAMKREMKKAA